VNLLIYARPTARMVIPTPIKKHHAKITLVESFTICFAKLQLPFMGVPSNKNNYTF